MEYELAEYEDVTTTELLSTTVLHLNGLEIDVKSCLQSIEAQQLKLIELRWEQGKIISEYAAKDNRYGNKWFERLEQGTGISERLLRQIKSFYESEVWHRDKLALEVWIEDQKNESGKAPNWTHIRNLVAKKQDLADPNKREVQRTNLERRAERLEQDAEVIQTTYLDAETQGVATKAFEVAGDTKHIIEIDRAETPLKPQTPRSSKYLAFIRTLPCCVTGSSDSVEAHHVFSGAMGMKESDFVAIPLSAEKHREFHQIGVVSFGQKYSVNYWQIIAKCMHLYFTGEQL